MSVQKCLSAFKIINGPVLIEDTALCFKALNGMPGPFIKWFLKAVGPDGNCFVSFSLINLIFFCDWLQTVYTAFLWWYFVVDFHGC